MPSRAWRFKSSQPHRGVGDRLHKRETVTAALTMAERGATQLAISSELGVPRRTVNDWLRGRTPREADSTSCPDCGRHRDFSLLDQSYVHLLGLYLGDGCLSAYPRRVFKLRVTLDVRYPEIIASAKASTETVIGAAASVYKRVDRCVEVGSYSRQWPCLFPQHGPGLKHHRVITLTDWQRELVERWPDELLRGLIESDGCRFQNTGRGEWSHARYKFDNHSADIHAIFRDACDLLDVHWTTSAPYTTYVSRVADVARLDEFTGPKR